MLQLEMKLGQKVSEHQYGNVIIFSRRFLDSVFQFPLDWAKYVSDDYAYLCDMCSFELSGRKRIRQNGGL